MSTSTRFLSEMLPMNQFACGNSSCIPDPDLMVENIRLMSHGPGKAHDPTTPGRVDDPHRQELSEGVDQINAQQRKTTELKSHRQVRRHQGRRRLRWGRSFSWGLHRHCVRGDDLTSSPAGRAVQRGMPRIKLTVLGL